MDTQIVKWGNGQGIRIPKIIMKQCGFHVDEPVTMMVINGQLVIKKAFVHQTLEQRAESYGGKLGPYAAYDWGEPVGNEVF